jgi:outer membrane cobalamin receptor
MLRCKGSISLLRARSVQEDGRQGPIPFRSAWSGQVEVTLYKQHLTSSLSLLSAGMTLSYRGQRVADPAGLIVIPSQASLDLLLSAALAERVYVKMRIENLTNQLRYDALGYPLPSRGYYLSLEMRY